MLLREEPIQHILDNVVNGGLGEEVEEDVIGAGPHLYDGLTLGYIHTYYGVVWESAVVREQIRDEIVRCTWSSSFFVEYYLELIERPFFLPSVRIKSSFFIALFIGILTII